MRRFLLIAVVAACGCTSTKPTGSPLPDGLSEARKEIIRLRCENFALRLKEARRERRHAEECRLLREEGLSAAVGELRLMALKEILAAQDLNSLLDCGLADPLARLAATETDPAILEKAVDAVALIHGIDSGAAVVSALKRATTYEVRWSALHAIGKLQVTEAAPLVRGFLDASQAPNIRELAIQVLGKLKDEGSLLDLIRVLREDGDDRMRETAARSIGIIDHGASIEALIVAFLKDKSPVVRKTAWTSLVTLRSDLQWLCDLATRLLLVDWQPEWVDLGNRLAAFKPTGPARETTIVLIERAAAKATAARDESMLLRLAVGLDPNRLDLLRKTSDACRRNHDYVAALKYIGEVSDRLGAGSADWWEVELDRIFILQDSGAVFEAAAHASNLLGRKPANAIRIKVENAFVLVMTEMADLTEKQRAAAGDWGKKFIGTLADLLEDPTRKESRKKLLAAGFVVTGIVGGNDDRTTAEAWRAWALK